MRTNLVFYPRSVLALVTRQPPFPLSSPLVLIGAICDEETRKTLTFVQIGDGSQEGDCLEGGNLVHFTKVAV